jgi:hypothetical protein
MTSNVLDIIHLGVSAALSKGERDCIALLPGTLQCPRENYQAGPAQVADETARF